jgi:hypothetical protein
MRINAVVAALAIVLAISLSGCGADESTASTPPAGDGSVTLDVVHLDHPPVRSALTKVDEIVAKYQNDLVVRKVDAETDDGRALAERNGATGHVAILLLLNGKPEAEVDGRTVRFEGFPEGASPIKSAQGSWALDQLDKALATLVGR